MPVSAIRARSAVPWLVVGLLAFSLSLPARADERPVPEQPGAWLVAVRQAAERKEKPRLQRLAKAPALDPWVAVDALHLDGAFEVVGDFADACETSDAKALAVYARAVKDRRLKARELLARAASKGSKGEAAEAVKMLKGMPSDAPGKVRADALSFTGKYQMQQGLWREAATSYGASEQAAAKLGWHQGQLDALANQVHALDSGGDFEEQGAVLERRRELAERLGAELPALETRVWQGARLARLGRPREGADAIRAALPRLEELEAYEYTGEAHGTLAQALANAGQLALALHHSYASEQAYAKIGHTAGVLYARSTAIATCSELGLDEYVSELCKKQVDQTGSDPAFARERAHALLAWAVAEARLGWTSKATEHFAKAWKYFSVAAGVDRKSTFLLNRGRELYEPDRETERAVKDYRAVLALPGLPDQRRAYAHVFLASTTRGGEAAAHASKALAVARRTGDDTLEVLALAASADAALEGKRFEEALRLARRATGLALHGTASLGNAHAMGFLGGRGPLQAKQALVRASLRLDDPNQIFLAAETSRAIALLSSMGGRSHVLRISEPTPLVRELESAVAQRKAGEDALDAARRQHQGLKARRQLVKRLDGLREAERGLAARIQGERARIAGVATPEILDAEAVRVWLKPREAVVQLLISEGGVHAIVVHAKRSEHVRLGSMEALAELAEALEDHRDPDVPVPAKQPGQAPALDALAEALVGRLALPPGISDVIVVPPAELANLPWPLMGRAARDVRITLCPSAGVLLKLDHRALDARQPRVAVGVTKYEYDEGGVARRVYAGSRPLADLGSTAAEARFVAGSKGQLLLDAGATEGAVQDALRTSDGRRSVVHFACHGIFDRRRPSLSSLALLPSPSEDGFLTGAEILGLQLDSDLVVLSSCDTGSLAAVPGEGAVGLPGALLGAGASRVLANLWRVSDEAGPAFARLFYAHLEKHGDVHAALAHAQGELPKQNAEWAHPYYWAGWVIWGSPR